MKPQIKTFTNYNFIKLDEEVNKFLELDHIKFISMTQSSCTTNSIYEGWIVITIVYENNA